MRKCSAIISAFWAGTKSAEAATLEARFNSVACTGSRCKTEDATCTSEDSFDPDELSELSDVEFRDEDSELLSDFRVDKRELASDNA